jgi:hypothetical protein
VVRFGCFVSLVGHKHTTLCADVVELTMQALDENEHSEHCFVCEDCGVCS